MNDPIAGTQRPASVVAHERRQDAIARAERREAAEREPGPRGAGLTERQAAKVRELARRQATLELEQRARNAAQDALLRRKHRLQERLRLELVPYSERVAADVAKHHVHGIAVPRTETEAQRAAAAVEAAQREVEIVKAEMARLNEEANAKVAVIAGLRSTVAAVLQFARLTRADIGADLEFSESSRGEPTITIEDRP